MHAESPYAPFEWSFLQSNFIFIIKTSILLSRVPGKSGVFVQCGYQALHCVHPVVVLVFQCHALNHHKPIRKKCNFFSSCTWFNKFCDFSVQSVRHTSHFPLLAKIAGTATFERWPTSAIFRNCPSTCCGNGDFFFFTRCTFDWSKNIAGKVLDRKSP